MDREQLISDVERELSRYFQDAPLVASLRGRHWKPTTRATKEFLCKLGKDKGLEVSARECEGAASEWLYDMVWFELDNGYLKRQVLAMESELDPDPTIDGDFQKLVQARADVRLWIACLPNAEMQAEHLANCKRQAALFSGAAEADTYIFVTDNWTNPKTSVERFVVGRNDTQAAG